MFFNVIRSRTCEFVFVKIVHVHKHKLTDTDTYAPRMYLHMEPKTETVPRRGCAFIVMYAFLSSQLSDK